MGDMGELFNAMREEKRERKRAYQKNDLPRDLAMLKRLKNVSYEIKNGGEHYILTVTTDRGERMVDYWPSTGYWKVRDSKAKGARIHHLKRYFKLTEEDSNVHVTALSRRVD